MVVNGGLKRTLIRINLKYMDTSIRGKNVKIKFAIEFCVILF